MILSIDIGNTSTSFGLFKGYKILYRKNFPTELLYKGSIFDNLIKGAINFARKKNEDIEGVCFASVVPRVSAAVNRTLRRMRLPAVNVARKTPAGIKIKMRNPKEVGADRIVNAACAYHHFGGPCAVVDMGTATTIDCVDKGGSYIGGMIMPGIKLAARALNEYTAKLPLVEFKKPSKSVGNDTVSAINSGLYFGNIGMVENALSECLRVLGKKSIVILTGGYGDIFFGKIKGIEFYWPDITLVGLRLIWDFTHLRGAFK